MKKSKKLFAVIVFIFILLMLYFAYDVSKKTTAPWNKNKQEKATDKN